MITQLNPPLPLDTPKGAGLAHFVIDYGPEADLLWVVFMNADGACWAVPNPDIRMSANWSMGRRKPQPRKPEPSAQADDNETPLAPGRVHKFSRATEI